MADFTSPASGMPRNDTSVPNGTETLDNSCTGYLVAQAQVDAIRQKSALEHREGEARLRREQEDHEAKKRREDELHQEKLEFLRALKTAWTAGPRRMDDGEEADAAKAVFHPFSGINREHLVAIFSKKFDPENLWKLNSLTDLGKGDRNISIGSDGKAMYPASVWSEGFSSYALIEQAFHGAEGQFLYRAHTTFCDEVMKLAAIYCWETAVFRLALDFHEARGHTKTLHDPTAWTLSERMIQQYCTGHRKPARVFHPFMKLPFQLRENIWLLALPPRVITVYPEVEACPHPGDPNRTWNIRIVSDSSIAAIGETCREARKIFKARYSNLADGESIYIDFLRDTLFLEWAAGSSFGLVSGFLRESFPKIKSIAINFKYCAFEPSTFTDLQSFRQLLLVVSCGIDYGIGSALVDFRNSKPGRLSMPYTSNEYMWIHAHKYLVADMPMPDISLVEAYEVTCSHVSTRRITNSTLSPWSGEAWQLMRWFQAERQNFNQKGI
ncbi:uncharacterized protein PAC_15145 [Phialocephala subalpina]|uniref:2EXR domain-containing protein n=1 Tax=Phialocephala subalpina TaxID=576137 RepID=A0A1L7XJM2_9HELO|nr:uncharacterized protein PAC_15145 [Phialocephala subalpina]